MIDTLLLVLLISFIGISLVFLIILLLWGFMALLTHLFRDRETQSELQQEEIYSDNHKAALLAVSLALQSEAENTPHEFPLPPTALVSAWQAVMRSNIITKRGRIR